MEHPIYLLLRRVTGDYPRFDDGRIDYRGATASFGLICFVLHDGHILLAERGVNVMVFPLHWSGISGFIDTHEPIEELALRELSEEVGILRQHIISLTPGPTVTQRSPSTVCHIVPIRVELHTKPELQTNWENKRVKWVPMSHLSAYKLIPGFMDLFNTALATEDDRTRS